MRPVPLAAPHDVASVGERRHDSPASVALRVAAGVIEVEMAVDHHRHVGGGEARLRERALELRGQPRSRRRVRSRCRRCRGTSPISLLPDARVDEHEAVRMLDQQAAHAERNAVARVRGDARSQSVFGTTPNMAPPSSCWRPAWSAWTRSAPSVRDWTRGSRGMAGAGTGVETAQATWWRRITPWCRATPAAAARRDAGGASSAASRCRVARNRSSSDHRSQPCARASSSSRMRHCAVAIASPAARCRWPYGNLHIVVARTPIERPRAQLRQQPPREAHGAEPPAGEHAARVARAPRCSRSASRMPRCAPRTRAPRVRRTTSAHSSAKMRLRRAPSPT